MVSRKDHKARKEFLTSDLRVLTSGLTFQRFSLSAFQCFLNSSLLPAQSYPIWILVSPASGGVKIVKIGRFENRCRGE